MVCSYFFVCLVKILCSVISVEATTPPMNPTTTLPPSTPRPTPTLLSRYSSSLFRHDLMLEAKPIRVYKEVSRLQCFSLCLRHQTGKKNICKSFNYGNSTCYLLKTYVCDGEKVLTKAPGFSYFDLVSNYEDEVEFFKSKQCRTKGKCSNKCRKYKLIKTPLSWHDAQFTCREEEAHLAMPKTMKDHEAILTLLKNGNMLQSWIGLGKKSGEFFYTDGTPLNTSFTLWGPDQPNDSGGTQQCVQVMSEMDYLWNDFDCARPVGFICQYVW